MTLGHYQPLIITPDDRLESTNTVEQLDVEVSNIVVIF